MSNALVRHFSADLKGLDSWDGVGERGFGLGTVATDYAWSSSEAVVGKE